MFNLYFHNLNTEEQQKEIIIPVMASTIQEATQEAEKMERENNWQCWGAQRLIY